MKPYRFFLSLVSFTILAVLVTRALAAETTPLPRLAGIVDLPEMKRAALVSSSVRSPSNPELLLGEGQREALLEVVRIDPSKATVDIRLGSLNPAANPAGTSSIGFEDPSRHLEPGQNGLLLERASLGQVLAIYQQLANRTLLTHPQLQQPVLSAKMPATNAAEQVILLANMLAEHHIATIPDGEKFIMVVPDHLTNSMHPHAKELATQTAGNESKAPPSTSNAAEEIPPGVIRFLNVDMVQVADIYAELRGKKLDRASSQISGALINFHTQNPLSKAEVIYALETLFEWNGVKPIVNENNQLRLVRMPQ